MEQQKTYRNTKFPSKILCSTRKLLEQQAKDNEANKGTWFLNVRVSDTEMWEFDSEDEFFAAYRDGIVEAIYSYQLDMRSVRMSLYKSDTILLSSEFFV